MTSKNRLLLPLLAVLVTSCCSYKPLDLGHHALIEQALLAKAETGYQKIKNTISGDSLEIEAVPVPGEWPKGDKPFMYQVRYPNIDFFSGSGPKKKVVGCTVLRKKVKILYTTMDIVNAFSSMSVSDIQSVIKCISTFAYLNGGDLVIGERRNSIDDDLVPDLAFRMSKVSEPSQKMLIVSYEDGNWSATFNVGNLETLSVKRYVLFFVKEGGIKVVSSETLINDLVMP